MESEQKKPMLVGIIGGIGPYAGLDFLRNIFNNTKALKDQEHIDCVLVSCPSIIPDRTEYILSSGGMENPAIGLFESAKKLHAAGVSYAVAACNTAHAGRIYGPFRDMVKESLPGLTIVNMLETCANYVKKSLKIKRVGLLATIGTHQSKVYYEYFGDFVDLIEPDAAGQAKVHEAIYSKEFGVKAFSQPVTLLARKNISQEIVKLVDQGAQAIILGCTELPLAIQASDVSVAIVDPGLIAARALVALAAPEKLLSLV